MSNNPNPTPPAPPEPPNPPNPPTPPKEPDLAAQVATLTAQLAELAKAKKEADDKAAETARAAMTAEQRLEADRTAVDTDRKKLVKEVRDAAAERLGVLPKFLGMVPDVDTRTPEGAKALADWARDNPELVKAAPAGGGLPPVILPESNVAKILSGKMKHPLIDAESIRKHFGGAA